MSYISDQHLQLERLRVMPLLPSMSSFPPSRSRPMREAGGAINPATAQTIAQGATTTFTVTPDEGYAAAVAGSCGGASGRATPTRRMRLRRRAR